MTQDFDGFFIDEDDVDNAQAASVEQEDVNQEDAAPVQNAHHVKPPTFAMACVIACVALVCGLGIGYGFGMYVSAHESESAGDTQVDSESQELPEGHPDLAQFYNEDGTINEEALAAYIESSQAETE